MGYYSERKLRPVINLHVLILVRVGQFVCGATAGSARTYKFSDVYTITKDVCTRCSSFSTGKKWAGLE